ncbi:MAG: hypothetical protein R3D30_03595 [Hyphomicrobiales bacterium]
MTTSPGALPIAAFWTGLWRLGCFDGDGNPPRDPISGRVGHGRQHGGLVVSRPAPFAMSMSMRATITEGTASISAATRRHGGARGGGLGRGTTSNNAR